MPIRPAFPRLACLSALLLCAGAARAADTLNCPAPVLQILGRELKVAHFSPDANDFGTDRNGVIVTSTCKAMPGDPRLTLAAAAWDAGKADEKSLVIAVVDVAAGASVALLRDAIGEDAATQVNNGSLRLDTAPYELAPGVRAFGVDVASDDRSCGEGGMGASRTLYVREGRTLRPVLAGLTMQQWWYLRGNQPRCSGPGEEAPILEDYDVTIGLGAPGKGGWRDLSLTATARRSDHQPGRKPLHVRLPYDGAAYPLDAFEKAYAQWRR